MTLPSRYGVGAGPYRLLPGDVVTLRLNAGGVNVSKSPVLIEEGESPNAVDVRLSDGGVSTDYGLTLLGTAYSGVEDKTITGLFEFTRKDATDNQRLVRMRPTGWDRWDGANWLTLNGSLSGISTDRPYVVAMQDKLVMASRGDKLKVWDGLDASPVADLSPDAPNAYFITPIGNRLMAARLMIGSSIDPYAVKWCADALITNWTSASLGAGTLTLEPEGRGGGPDFIMGLSALETAAVLFRQHSIVMAVRTGIGAAPFRFNTVIHGLGTESPYTIVSAGNAIGTIFLGNDLNVYLFNGQSAPVPIGDPIRLYLRPQIQDPELCVGIMDLRNLEYWLLVKRSGSLPDLAWIFDVRAMVLGNRLSWRRRDFPGGVATMGFSRTVLQTAPVVNSIGDIVNTVGIRVNDYGLSISPETIVLGDGSGGVSYVDSSKLLTSGVWESKILGNRKVGTEIDKVYLTCSSPTGASIEVSLSIDSGATWVEPKVVTIPVSNYARPVGTWFNLVVESYQYRLRILSGNVTISEIEANVSNRGPISA